MHGIPKERAVAPELLLSTKDFSTKFAISGKTEGDNVFRLGPKSFGISNSSTLWLSPEFVDFGKRIEIKGRGNFKGSAKVSTKVLLEDVLRRADREHPYWARIDNRGGNWIAND